MQRRDRPDPRKRPRSDHDTNLARHKRPKKAEKVDDSLSLVGRDLRSNGEGYPDLSTHPNLHKLDLHDSQIDKLAFLGQAKATLTLLNLSGVRGITSWKGLNELEGLFVLNISNCGLDRLPKQIASLSSLKALIATHNELTKLDYLDYLSNLNTLVVSHNQIASLPPLLAALKELKKISCAHAALTSNGLPDLSTLPLLHELRLNDNRSLSKLPSHFGTWGKANEVLGKRSGLEIVDLGNCAFDDWYALKELADQANIANLNIKGNSVVQDASADFDDYKRKVRTSGLRDSAVLLRTDPIQMLVLLPNLRVLDGHRFDTKFADLKTKRDQRSEAERILDAGPIAIARNAAADAPVDLQEAEKMRMKNKARTTGATATSLPADRRGTAHDSKESDDDQPVPIETEEAAEDNEQATEEPRKKRKKKNRHEKTENDAEEPVDEEKSKKKNKRRKSKAAEAEAAESDEDDSQGEEEQTEIFRKRGRKSKFMRERGGAPKVPYAIAGPEAEDERDGALSRKKDARGVLAALRGDDEEDSEDAPSREPTKVATAPAPAVDEGDGKETKTSVVKVVQVKKPKKKSEPIDVTDLLKQTKAPEAISGWD